MLPATFACLPVDTSKLPDVGIPPPAVTPEHMETICQRCHDLVWIGPRQLRDLRTRDNTGDRILCYMCAIYEMKTYGEVEIVNLTERGTT